MKIINWKLVKLFGAILLLNFLPTLYDTIKIFFINLSDVSINIFGQIEWFDLINETIYAFLIVPLYFILHKYFNDDIKRQENNLAQLLLLTGGIYLLFILFAILNIDNLNNILNVDVNANYYLILESIGFIFEFVYGFAYVVFVCLEDYKTILVLLCIKVLSMVGLDIILSVFNDGYGIIYAAILSKLIISLISLLILINKKILKNPFKSKFLNKDIILDLVKIGLCQGISILLANIVYAKYIMGFVNSVKMSGIYWMANSFIWGYMLLPITSLQEIVKVEASNYHFKIKRYFIYTLLIVFLLILLRPGYGFWLNNVMGVEMTLSVLYLIDILFIFYIVYMFNAIIEAYFVGIGKTNYLIISNVIVNLGYYPIVLNLKIFDYTIEGICYLFGFGMIINFLILAIIYLIYKKIYQ